LILVGLVLGFSVFSQSFPYTGRGFKEGVMPEDTIMAVALRD
jgi:hypothetical protein